MSVQSLNQSSTTRMAGKKQKKRKVTAKDRLRALAIYAMKNKSN